MKALIYQGKQQLTYEDCPTPTPHNDEVLLEVEACGICGSDMHAYLGHDNRRPPPLILGHEIVALYQKQTMVINPLVVCGQCHFCQREQDNLCPYRQIISMPPRPGGFAQQLCMPPKNLHPLPPSLSIYQGALTEPMACGHHAINLAVVHSHQPSDKTRSLIIGGGAIGLACALSLIARNFKSVTLIDPNDNRRQYLQSITPLRKLAPNDLSTNESFDIVIDAVGNNQTQTLSSTLVSTGGVIVHIGLAQSNSGFDMRRHTLQGIVVVGSYTYTATEFTETLSWMAQGRLGRLDWFDVLPLKEGARAFADLLEGKVAAPKILLTPPQ